MTPRTAVPLLAALALPVLLGAAPPATTAPGCEVVAAELTWGFKESFRAYIDGSIANGEWTVADGATYTTPEFGFPVATGVVDPRGPGGRVEFDGSVRFTGHGGILDTTIANPVLVFRGAGEPALLLLDVTGDTMAGDSVESTGTPFVEVDLSGQDLSASDGTVRLVEATTTLTAEGEVAFPNYPAGTEFDPITVTIDVGDCDLGTAPGPGTDSADDPGTGDPGTDSSAGLPAWAVIAGSVAGLLAIVTVVLVVAVRRRG